MKQDSCPRVKSMMYPQRRVRVIYGRDWMGDTDTDVIACVCESTATINPQVIVTQV